MYRIASSQHESVSIMSPHIFNINFGKGRYVNMIFLAVLHIEL